MTSGEPQAEKGSAGVDKETVALMSTPYKPLHNNHLRVALLQPSHYFIHELVECPAAEKVSTVDLKGDAAAAGRRDSSEAARELPLQTLRQVRIAPQMSTR